MEGNHKLAFWVSALRCLLDLSRDVEWAFGHKFRVELNVRGQPREDVSGPQSDRALRTWVQVGGRKSLLETSSCPKGEQQGEILWGLFRW